MKNDLLSDLRPPYYRIEHNLLDRGLSANAIAVYNVLARHANQQRQCFPSIRRVGRVLRLGKTTVRRALDELIGSKTVRQTERLDPHGGRSSNLYELLPLWEKGCPAPGTPGPTHTHGVPLQTQGCSGTGTELESFEQEPLNKGGATLSPDPLLELFSAGFLQRYRHRPRIGTKQRGDWRELAALNPVVLLRAKIDAWWDHPLPPTFRGNRTFGAFLQWFDDIPVNGAPPVVPGTSRTAEQWADEMRSGSSSGRQHYHELTAGISDPAAKQQTLRQYGGIHDDDVIDAIIAACDDAR